MYFTIISIISIVLQLASFFEFYSFIYDTLYTFRSSLFFSLLQAAPCFSVQSREFPRTSTNAFPPFSSDANIGGEATGAMSWAFITALKKNPQQSYVTLLNSIRDELSTRYTQKPQLSCSHPLSTSPRVVEIQDEGG